MLHFGYLLTINSLQLLRSYKNNCFAKMLHASVSTSHVMIKFNKSEKNAMEFVHLDEALPPD